MNKINHLIALIQLKNITMNTMNFSNHLKTMRYVIQSSWIKRLSLFLVLRAGKLFAVRYNNCLVWKGSMDFIRTNAQQSNPLHNMIKSIWIRPRCVFSISSIESDIKGCRKTITLFQLLYPCFFIRPLLLLCDSVNGTLFAWYIMHHGY